jgi:hypothetical protein
MTEKNTISVREFKMWLQGVEEMQEPNWIPTSAQWAKIRDKINCITDEPPVQQQAAAPLRLASPPAISQVHTNAPPNMPVAPAGPSSLSMPPRPAMPPNAMFGGIGAIKTPDIDTSGKGYESGFV